MKCFWVFGHDWGMWVEEANGKVRGDGDSVVGFFVRQRRACLSCGKIQLRKVTT